MTFAKKTDNHFVHALSGRQAQISGDARQDLLRAARKSLGKDLK